MKNAVPVGVVVLLLALVLAAKDNSGSMKVEMKNAKGERVGTATLSPTVQVTRMRSKWLGGKGVDIKLDLHDLPPGGHGIHLHRDPVCEPPDFQSAGGHMDPYGKQHGLKNADGPHAGDMENIIVDKNGKFKGTVEAKYVSMEQLKAGRALVIHANADDQMTDPAGNSGARIACGVIAKFE